MTTPETVADVLAPSSRFLQLAATAWCEPETSMLEMDTRLATAFARVMERESALAAQGQAEPVEFQIRTRLADSPGVNWYRCDEKLYLQVLKTGHTFNNNVRAEVRALYERAAPVESLGRGPGIDSPHFNAVAWFDTFNAHVYFNRDAAQRAHDGGNTVLPIESMAGSPPASVPDVIERVAYAIQRADSNRCIFEHYETLARAAVRVMTTTPEPTK